MNDVIIIIIIIIIIIMLARLFANANTLFVIQNVRPKTNNT